MSTLTDRRVLAIAIPIVLSNATVPILGAVDTAVVGQLGQAAPIGAVGLGAVILSAFYWFFGFLRMGTTGLAAQAIGAQDVPETNAILWRVLMIGLVAGMCLIAFQTVLFAIAFQFAPASDTVESLSADYMSIRIWSAPAAIALYGANGWLIAKERTRAVFVIQFVMNGLNILLDLVFVLSLGFGVQGVAAATVIAEYSGLAIALLFCKSAIMGQFERVKAKLLATEPLLEMFRVNSDILIRTLCLQVIFISFTMLGSGLGDVPLAANQVLLQFLFITAYALDGFAFAVEALVGQAMGAKSRALLRQSALICSKWGGIMVVLLSVSFALFGGSLIDIMATDDAVRQEARIYLIYMILAPTLGVASWMLDGIFIGATQTRDMRNMMALSMVIYVISVALLLPLLGNHGLWISLLISFVVRGVTLGLRYPRIEARVS